MNRDNEKSSKTLLSTIVRRHLRKGDAASPIGRLIAEEQRNLTRAAGTAANQDSQFESSLVERLYRRFFLQRDPTVNPFSAFAQETRLA